MWKNVAIIPRLAGWSNGGCRYVSKRVGSIPKIYRRKSKLEAIILEKMKLQRYRCFEKSEEPLSGLEPLKTDYHDLDLIHVRFKQPNLLFLRSELLLQRLEYLKPSGLLARQKRKLIERSPPVLVFTEDLENDKVNYLRGVIRTQKEGVEENVHLLHQSSRLLVMTKKELDSRMKVITEELRMAVKSALKMLLHLPCFLLHDTKDSPEKFTVMHKYDLPKGYSIDHHTAHIYPPVYSAGLEINPRLFTIDSDEELAQTLPKLSLGDLLDYSYPTHHGKGKPEDLTNFLIDAERREIRPKYNRIM